MHAAVLGSNPQAVSRQPTEVFYLIHRAEHLNYSYQYLNVGCFMYRRKCVYWYENPGTWHYRIHITIQRKLVQRGGGPPLRVCFQGFPSLRSSLSLTLRLRRVHRLRNTMRESELPAPNPTQGLQPAAASMPLLPLDSWP